MADELTHLVQITDKWNNRRFTMKLRTQNQYPTVGNLLQDVHDLTDEQISAMEAQGLMGRGGVLGLEDIRTTLYAISDEGTLGERIDEVEMKQRGKPLKETDPLKFEQVKTGKEGYANIMLADLTLDRDDVPFTRNWAGFYARRWERHPEFKTWVDGVVKEAYGERGDDVLALKTLTQRKDFLTAVARRVHAAPYELYSRFIDRNITLKTGPETLQCIMDGRGGNCAEKAAAIDFIIANYGLDGHLVLSGDDAKGIFPYDALRRGLDKFDFVFKNEAQKYWMHVANMVKLDDTTPVLIDATGGPMPLLFAMGDEATEYFSQRKSLPVMFITRDEQYFYHDAPTDIAYDLLWCLEAWVPDIDLQHVLGPEGEDSLFGFMIRPGLWISPSLYQTEGEYQSYGAEWRAWAETDPRVKRLDYYANLDSSGDKAILSQLEVAEPQLIADIRTASVAFLKKCREHWRDTSWKEGYVFAELDNPELT